MIGQLSAVVRAVRL